MNRRLLAPAAAVLALGGFLAACGDDKKSEDEIITEFQESAGLTEEQARCVYDSLGDDANDFLNQSADDADDEEVARLTETMTTCMGGDITVPDLGEISIPDLENISIPEMPEISMPDIAGITAPEIENS